MPLITCSVFNVTDRNALIAASATPAATPASTPNHGSPV
jgi:hypothetical protein